MRSPAGPGWLEAWERAQALPPALRPVALLAADEGEQQELARLPIGARDRRLLATRASWFGATLDCVAACPACGDRLELSLACEALAAMGGPADDAPRTIVVEAGGLRIEHRLPDSLDLAAAAMRADLEGAADCLLARCATACAPGGESVELSGLPDDVREALDAALAEADPLAVVTLAVACVRCGHAWDALFDVAAHLWSELESRLGRLTREVHELASAYAWSESDVLAMSDARRERYLAIVRGELP